MNREAALKLWRTVANDAPTGLVTGRTLEAFATAVEAAERAACAKVAREFVWYEAENCSPDEGNEFIARAIEARGDAL